MTSIGLSVGWWPCSCICEVYSGTSQFLLTKKKRGRQDSSYRRILNQQFGDGDTTASTVSTSTRAKAKAGRTIEDIYDVRVKRTQNNVIDVSEGRTEQQRQDEDGLYHMLSYYKSKRSRV